MSTFITKYHANIYTYINGKNEENVSVRMFFLLQFTFKIELSVKRDDSDVFKVLYSV